MESAAQQLVYLGVLRAGRFACQAAGTVLLYDILLTTADEVKYIWPSQFSLPKCLYFANRYFPIPCFILGMYHLGQSRTPMPTNLAGQQLSLTTATWLLVLRVIALYGGKRFAAVGLYTLFISTHVAAIVIGITVVGDVWDDITWSPQRGICVTSGTHLIGIVYLTPVLCDLVLVVMQMVHGYRHTTQLGGSFLRPLTPLLRTLYVDGFVYFVVVATLRLWSAFTFLFAHPSYWYLSVYLEFSLISISVSRLVIHLQEAAQSHRAHFLGFATSIPLTELSTISSPHPIPTDENSPHHDWDSRPSTVPRKHATLSFQ